MSALARLLIVSPRWAVILALVVGSRVAHAETELSHLNGTFWQLRHIDGAKNVIVHIKRPTIEFSTSCQYVLHPIRYESGFLKLGAGGPAASRRYLCWLAQPFFMESIERNLLRVHHYTMSGDELKFLDDQSRPVMVLTRLVATGLEYREWSVAGYADGNKLVVPALNAQLTFAHGRFEGTPGCGALSGHYRLSGARLQVRIEWLLNGGYCPGDYGPQNEAVVKALSGRRFIEHDNGSIILRDAQDAAQIVLKP